MLSNYEACEKPEKVEIDELPEGGQWVKLHTEAEQREIPGESGGPSSTVWACREAAFRTGRDNRVTEEELLADWDRWWRFAAAWTGEEKPPDPVEQLRADVDFLAVMGGVDL